MDDFRYMSPQLTVSDQEALFRPLASKDNQTLRELLEDDSKIDELFNSVVLESRKKLVSQHEMTMMTNKSIAEFNMSHRPQLERGRENLKQLMLQIEQARDAVMNKEEQLRNSKSTLSAETALALLQTAAAESEEDSEKLADAFYQKDIDVEEFLEQFQDVRKRMHLRRVKADKMVELVSENNSRPVRRAAPPPPYPVGPF